MAIKTMLPIIYLLCICTAAAAQFPKATVLVDLDPNSSAQTVIVESVAADPQGLLYVCDRVTGNVLRIDPKNPKPVIVGRVETRVVDGKPVRADSSGLIFNDGAISI